MLELLKSSLIAQHHAALAMLESCVRACPDNRFDGPELIARYPFWMVVYHTLCYVDCYLCRDNDSWTPHPVFHPAGRAELEEEFPSRRFERDELLAYLELCRQRVQDLIGAESAESLAGPSGFGHLPFSRCELHLYSLRHAAHHTGQLTAFLRRAGVETRWVKTGRG
jgi:hypothetical protein